MTLALGILGMIVCVVFGAAVVAWWWPREESDGARPWLLILSVGAAAGIAATSGLYYLWLNTLMRWGVAYEVIEWVLIAVVGLGLWHHYQKNPKKQDGDDQRDPGEPGGNPGAGGNPGVRNDQRDDTSMGKPALLGSVPGWVMMVCLAVVACLFAVALAGLLEADPHGRWDAWAMWNVKAKFMVLGGADWVDLFKATPHPDYPLLHPGAVARLWVYCGIDDVAGPQLMSWTVMLLTVGVLSGAVWRLRGPVLGSAAGLVLLMTALVFKQAAAQYVDTTLGLYMLGALALLAVAWEGPGGAARGRLMLLVGVMLGAAAWSKNEGIAFALVVGVCVAVFSLPGGIKAVGRALWPMLVGALPFVLCVISVKLFYAGRAEVLDTGSFEQMLAKISDPQRHEQIVRSFWLTLRYAPDWLGLGLVGVLALLGGVRLDRRVLKVSSVVAMALLGQACIYYGVYLTTGDDLHWLLDTTGYRLFAQLWPGVVLLLFLPMRCPVRG